MSERLVSPAEVGVVMGSDSDWVVMADAAQVLRDFGVPHEVDVVSAHRMPEDMIEYGRSAAERGLKVIIAGAGGAAHLPGMLASVTSIPVIGVPVPLPMLDGMDSLLSIVQMPSGVPVATRRDRPGAQRRPAGGADPRGGRAAALAGHGRLPGRAARRRAGQGGAPARGVRQLRRLRLPGGRAQPSLTTAYQTRSATAASRSPDSRTRR